MSDNGSKEQAGVCLVSQSAVGDQWSGPKWVIGPCQGNAAHKYLKLTQAQQPSTHSWYLCFEANILSALLIMTRAHDTRLWQTIKTVS